MNVSALRVDAARSDPNPSLDEVNGLAIDIGINMRKNDFASVIEAKCGHKPYACHVAATHASAGRRYLGQATGACAVVQKEIRALSVS